MSDTNRGLSALGSLSLPSACPIHFPLSTTQDGSTTTDLGNCPAPALKTTSSTKVCLKL